MAEKITVLAVGGAGCRIMTRLRELPGAEHLYLGAIDSDRRALEATGLPADHLILAAEPWRNGQGCGGDTLFGQNAVARERERFKTLIGGSSLLVVIGGLGGGLATGGIPVILADAPKMQIPTIAIVSTPFSHEGARRRTVAEKALEELFQLGSAALVPLPNDLLFSGMDAATPVAEAFVFADKEMARSVLALTALVSSGNLLNTDYASFGTLLNSRPCYCSLGVGCVRSEEGARRVELAIEQMVHSPLLGGVTRLQEADAVILSVLGGSELSLGDARAMLDEATKLFRSDVKLLCGAAVAPAWNGMVQITALTMKFDDKSEERHLLSSEPPAVSGRAHRKKQNIPSDYEEPELPLMEAAEKGIMERTTPVFWNGEDLDVPTYHRKNLVINDGKHLL